MKSRFVPAILFLATTALGQTRLADDFERAALEKQIARERDPIARAAAHINLGDLDANRAEMTSARREFRKALEIASRHRRSARSSSHFTDYATATAYAALAHAKLGERVEAFALCEEAVRYLSDSAKTWNLYSSAMLVLGEHAKAASAARNAIAIASREAAESPTAGHLLDVNIYQYALASALMKLDGDEAVAVLARIVDSLATDPFDPIRREIARREAFEVFTSTRNDADAFLALHNRAGLRLGKLYEERGDFGRARAAYDRVLALRSDDPSALAALARLSANVEEKRRHYADAFEANPFSMDLIREYRRFAGDAGDADTGTATVGARMRRALQLLESNRRNEARQALVDLARDFPRNATIAALVREAERAPARPAILASVNRQGIEASESDLRAVIEFLSDEGALSAADRLTLDAMTFSSIAEFAPPQDNAFAGGSIGNIRFRFQQPTKFRGDFASSSNLRLDYRILGVAGDALLLDPIRVARP